MRASEAGLCRKPWWTSFERHCELCRALLPGPQGQSMPSTGPCGRCAALQSRPGLSCVSCVRSCWRPAGWRGVPYGRSSCWAACCTRRGGTWCPCTATPTQRRPHPREKVCPCAASPVLPSPPCPTPLNLCLLCCSGNLMGEAKQKWARIL